jgi:hypothetical protein
MKILLVIICISVSFTFLSCKSGTNKDVEVYQRVEKYESGEIKERKTYLNQNEYDLDENYHFYSYYPNGVLKEKAVFKNGLLSGNYYSYSEDNSLLAIKKFRHGLRHGVSITYDKMGNVLTEVLYIDDIKVRWKAFSVFKEKDMIGYQIFDIVNSGEGLVTGYYYINKNHEVINTMGNYYIVKSKNDTINFGNEYNAEIELIVFGGNNTYGEILIGDLDNNEEFVDSTSVLRLEFNNEKTITYSTKKYKIGDNLILGKIYVFQDTIIDDIKYSNKREFLLFHDFYVKQ